MLPKLFCPSLAGGYVTWEAVSLCCRCGLGLGERSVPIRHALLGQSWLDIESRERDYSPEIGFLPELWLLSHFLFYALGHLDKADKKPPQSSPCAVVEAV